MAGNLDAQETPAGAMDQSSQSEGQQGASPGVQARIDELTAKLYEKDSQFNRIMEQNNELLAQLALRQEAQFAAQQQPQAPDPALALDPEDAKKLEHFFQQRMAPLQQQLEQTRRALEQYQVRDTETQAEAQLRQVNNPAVERRVNDLMRAWQNHPTYRGATKMDALKIAMGEYAMGNLGTSVGMQQRNERGRFAANSVAPVASAVGRAPPPQAPVQAAQLPSNLSELTFEQLQRLNEEIDKQYPEGIPL